VSSATIWNRIEPRARSGGLAGGLAARVHDPLWLLARQWQMGEFAGRDAGSPLTAQVHWTTAAFDRFASGSAAPQPLTANTPIEMLIEREFVRPQQAAGDLLQAAESGLQFLRLLDAANLSRLRPAYIQQYPLAAPANAGSDALGFASVVAGRALNGIQLRANLATAPSGSLPAQPALSAADVTAVTPIATAWTAWYDSLFNEPAAPSSWSPARMEYSFALGAAADANGLVAQEYDGGSIDWYSFDRATSPLAGGTAQPVTSSRTITVAPVTFRGMPARRFWQIENAAVNIGALDAAASDIGRLLLREFALTYGNDWFQIPLALPVGCHAVINSLSIIDTFGLTTTIPHYAAVDGAFGNWQLFSVDIVGPSLTAPNEAPTTNLLILPPAASTFSTAPRSKTFSCSATTPPRWRGESSAPSPALLAPPSTVRSHGVPRSLPSCLLPAQPSPPTGWAQRSLITGFRSSQSPLIRAHCSSAGVGSPPPPLAPKDNCSPILTRPSSSKSCRVRASISYAATAWPEASTGRPTCGSVAFAPQAWEAAAAACASIFSTSPDDSAAPSHRRNYNPRLF
jgi:hypothetical protein